tara:strand:+ start:324 stop:950 length:627 start_codon:yes stop_codon:yes gene_type:complete
MAEKPQARGMPIPAGMTVPDESPNATMFTESVEIEPEMDEGLPEPTPEEAKQIDMVLGTLKDFIWDEGYDEIATRLEQANPENLAQAIGEAAGRMLNREVNSAREGGVEVSDGILMSVGAELVNEITNIAEKEQILPQMDERQIQELQGEALIHATQQYVDESPQPIDPAGPMRLAANALRGSYPGETEKPRMGVPIQEEVITEEVMT